MGRRRAAQVPRVRQTRVGGGCALHAEQRSHGVPELLQDARAADAVRELRGAQWLADSDSRARHHGAVVVSRRRLNFRVDGCGTSQGDRVLRAGANGWDEAWGRRDVVGGLVQRLHLVVRDRAWARCLRAGAERADFTERDRGREARASRLLQHAGSAETHLAGHLCCGARICRSTRALERPRDSAREGGTAGARPCGEEPGDGAAGCVDAAGRLARPGRRDVDRSGEAAEALGARHGVGEYGGERGAVGCRAGEKHRAGKKVGAQHAAPLHFLCPSYHPPRMLTASEMPKLVEPPLIPKGIETAGLMLTWPLNTKPTPSPTIPNDCDRAVEVNGPRSLSCALTNSMSPAGTTSTCAVRAATPPRRAPTLMAVSL